MEEPLGALGLVDLAGLLAGVVVAAELVDGGGDGLGDRGALALDDGEGDAVDEEDDVGANRALGHAAGAVDLELADGGEGVPFGVVPVDEVDGPVAPLVPVGEPLDGDAVEEEAGGLLIGLHEPRVPDALQGAGDLRDARLVEPWLAIAEVDAAEGSREIVFQQHFPEAVAPGHGGVIEAPGDDLPPHGGELIEEGLFDLGELGPCGHGSHSSPRGRSVIREEAPTIQVSATGGLFHELFRRRLEGRDAEASKGLDQLGARHTGDLGRAALRHELELVPLDGGREAHLPAERRRIFAERGQRAFGKLEDQLHHGGGLFGWRCAAHGRVMSSSFSPGGVRATSRDRRHPGP